MKKRSRRWLAIGAAWILSLGFDLLLHGGLLARLYIEASPFLLSAAVAFRRIPIGYAAFLVLTIGLDWLLRRLAVEGALLGLRYGAVGGATLWGALALGLYSISTATVPLLAGWWIGQTVELALAGCVLGWVAGGASLRRVWAVVIVVVVLCVATTVVLQSFGMAPAMRIGL